jgi:hypothetical protein
MDRFTACGSKRPSMLADKSIVLRLPSWSPNEAALPVEGEHFQSGSNLQYHSGTGKKSQGSTGMLLDIVRILGVTNRYLAAGGVKGDSHFPWHSLSNLSKIRQELDIWASGTQDVFTSIDALFGQSDSTTLVLSKLIYHLIHCLIYRPFLPIDLLELAGTGQHQSWQIEATNMCFLHANAIAELVELGKQSGSIEWPAFVGYCICTAGTVHVHGAHYKGGHEGEVFSTSAEFLSREMQQLSELRYSWVSVQHQRDTLQTIYGCHSELVKSLASSPMRYSPVFHLEDFFDRYSTLGQSFDGAHISFADVTIGVAHETYSGHDLYAPRAPTSDTTVKAGESSSKRKPSAPPRRKHDKASQPSKNMDTTMVSADRIIDFSIDPFQQAQQTQEPHPLNMPPPQHQHIPPDQNDLLTFSTPHMPTLSSIPFSPPYNFSNDSFDPMFGMPQMGLSGEGIGMSGEGYSGDGFEYAGEGFASNQPAMTPGGRSNGESTGSREEKDPFLTLLEQLAENEHSRGGPSELDFYLTGQGTYGDAG